MSPFLRMWLGAIYRADVLKEGSYEEAISVVRGRLDADQNLRREAEEELRRLKPVVRARPTTTHVEKKTVEYLEVLLKKEKVNG